MKRTLAMLALLVLLAPAAHAQSLWLPRDREKTITLEALRPGVEFVQDKFLTAAFFLDLRYRAGSQATVVAEVPYATLRGDYLLFLGSPSIKESTLGNLYLGLEGHGEDSPLFGEFGVRFPTTPDDKGVAAGTGTYADLGRFNSFLPKVASAQAAFNVRTVSDAGIASRLRLGTAVAVSTEGGDPEVFGLYAWQIGYEGKGARIGVAASGNVLVTQDIGNLGSRSLTQLELHGDAGTGRVRPGLEVKLPLGSAANFVSVVVGASLSVALGGPPTSE